MHGMGLTEESIWCDGNTKKGQHDQPVESKTERGTKCCCGLRQEQIGELVDALKSLNFIPREIKNQ